MSGWIYYKSQIFAVFAVTWLFYNPTNSEAVQLTSKNFDSTLVSNELVLVNFYADWCRFSNMLMPIFDEAATLVAKQIPEAGKIVMGKVDCDQESDIASRFQISKYPTLKLIRNGLPVRKEYRGQRSAEAFAKYIKQELADMIIEYKNISELQLEADKRIIIARFESKDGPEYETFKKVATSLKDDCQFHVGFRDVSTLSKNKFVFFRPNRDRSNDDDEAFNGNLSNFDELHIWTQEKCVPLVREITFENAEELTEEGLPFLILFHSEHDKESIKKYNEVVKTELLSEKQQINFLTADGHKFAHPLHHLGKSEQDLPLLAIDSFRHMYLFPKFEDIEVPGKLKQFLQDLYSGKLHREFHYGPEGDTETDKQSTKPPESTFKKLAPSKTRYTLLRDEL